MNYEDLELIGVWSQPDSDRKVYMNGRVVITWKKNSRDLQFSGEDAGELNHKACMKIYSNLTKDDIPMENPVSESSDSLKCQCRCSELLIDVQGLKLDHAVDVKHKQKHVSYR